MEGEAPKTLLGLHDVDLRVVLPERDGVRALHPTRTWNGELSNGAIFVVDPDGTRIELVQSSGARLPAD